MERDKEPAILLECELSCAQHCPSGKADASVASELTEPDPEPADGLAALEANES